MRHFVRVLQDEAGHISNRDFVVFCFGLVGHGEYGCNGYIILHQLTCMIYFSPDGYDSDQCRDPYENVEATSKLFSLNI